MMRRASFHQPRDSCGQGRRICPNEEMYMITLYSQLKNLPIMRIGHFMDDLLKPTSYRPSEDLPPSPWPAENMGHHQMDGMAIMKGVHGSRPPYLDTSVKSRARKSPMPKPQKGMPIHPPLERRGFLGRVPVKRRPYLQFWMPIYCTGILSSISPLPRDVLFVSTGLSITVLTVL